MKKACCLCLEIAPLTREHKIKRSLLEYFNNLQNTSQDKALKFDDGTDNGGNFSNIKRARILKPKKNICTECNSSRSADCDPYFDKFVIDAFHWQDNIPEIRALTSPHNDDVLREANHQKGNIVSEINDTLWTNSYLFICSKYLITSKYQIYTHSYNVQVIKKYLAKHTICYFNRMGIDPSARLRDIFLESKSLDALDFIIYFLPKDFQHGYMNTMIKMPESTLRYALIFSNLAIQVMVIK